MFKKNKKNYSISLNNESKEKMDFIQNKLKARSLSETIKFSLSLVYELFNHMKEDELSFTVVDPNNKDLHIKYNLAIEEVKE